MNAAQHRQIFALALALSAGLMFAVQPFIGRLLLLHTGGAPTSWLSALCFFQLSLLVGYFLTHVGMRLNLRIHLLLMLGLVLAGFACLPPVLKAELGASTHPADILLLLARHVGIPFVALAMVSGTLQRLFHARYPSLPVYRLYAASNAGSLLGLLLYPLLLEPFLHLSAQGLLWTGLYFSLAVVLLSLAVKAPSQPGQRPQHPPLAHCWYWFWLAAIPCSLSFGLTELLTNGFGSLPVFWIIPLFLYLLSLIIAFRFEPPRRADMLVLAGQALLLASFVLILSGGIDEKIHAVPMVMSFFLLALFFHWRLAALKPGAEILSTYYLWLAAGGAAGGLFNVLVVPMLLKTPIEYALVATAAGLTVAGKVRRISALGLVGVLVYFLLILYSPHTTLYRNFFGAVMVSDSVGQNGQTYRWLVGGDGFHGNQQLTPAPVYTPGLYFTPLVPVMARPEFARIGMVGIGAGMALCFTAPNREFTVYEIDPKFRQIAEEQFSYISHCGAPHWRMGDGRLLLTEDANTRYDMIIVDAFQGGHIPLHLISLEALRLYQSRLTPAGILLMNLNSRYYDFYPQMLAQAQATHWQIWRATDTWVLLAPPARDVSWLGEAGWEFMAPHNEKETVSVWHDDYANLLGALRIFNP